MSKSTLVASLSRFFALEMRERVLGLTLNSIVSNDVEDSRANDLRGVVAEIVALAGKEIATLDVLSDISFAISDIESGLHELLRVLDTVTVATSNEMAQNVTQTTALLDSLK